jgi:hypothetical protein
LESNFSSMFVYFYHLYTLPFSQFQTVVRLINRKKLITVLNKYPRFCSEYVYSCFSENGVKRLEEDMKFISPLAFPYSEFVERKTMADLYNNKNKYFR